MNCSSSSTPLSKLPSFLLRLFGALLLLAAAPASAASLVFGGGAAAGCTLNGSTYTCATLPTTSDITIASGYTVNLTGSMNFDYNQQLNMSGTAKLTSSGDLNIGNVSPSNLNITGGTLVAGGTFSIGAQAQTITANVSAATLSIGTGSATKITGSLTASGQVNLASHVTIVGPISGGTISTNSPVDLTGDITASTAFTLASGSDLVGNVTAPTVTLSPSSVTVKGNIAASTSLTIGSGNSVTGNVSGGALTIAPSNASITGNVNLSGDVDIGSGDTINGDVVAHNVTTESSNGYISGNASVNAITLGYGGRVGKTITCTGVGASGCSCVTNNSGYANGSANGPVCGAAAGTVIDHFQITQPGTGLTCQPQTISVTACADSACSATVNSTVTAMLTVNGASAGTISISNGVNNNVQVSQNTSGSVTLGVSPNVGFSATNSTTCNPAGNHSCAMVFSDTGLVLALPAPSQWSGTSQALTISALQKVGNNPSCVPLFTSTSKTIALCGAYLNPASGTLPLMVNGTALPNGTCGGGQNFSVSFDNTGTSTTSLALSYADVGQMTLTAQTSGASNPPTVTGTLNFIVAPYAFQFTAPGNPGATTVNGPVFTKAAAPFQVQLAAVNSSGAVTPNFGHESPAESYTVKPSLTLPDATNYPNGDDPPLSNIGLLSSQYMVNGTTPSQTLSWNEVGVVKLSATLNNPAGYLGAGVTGFTTKGSVNLGRFVPDHFDLAINTVTVPGTTPAVPQLPMACGGNCPPSQLAIFSGQAFGVTVTASGPSGANNASTALANYQGGLAKQVTFDGWAAAGSLAAADQDPPTGSQSGMVNTPLSTPAINNAIAAGADPLVISPQTAQFVNGVASTLIGYQFGKLSAPTNVYFRATDSDGATSARGGSSLEPGVQVLNGRLQLSNNYGSELGAMPVQTKAQYWNGATYINATAFYSAALPLTGALLSGANCSLNLRLNSNSSACNTSLPVFTLPAGQSLTFNKGQAQFRLAPPGSGHNGSVNLSLDTSTLIPYLPGVSGVETFGVYRAGPVLYQREVY